MRKKTLFTIVLAVLTILALPLTSFAALPSDILWKQVSNPSIGWDNANAIAIDATGVYVAGTNEVLGGSNNEWRIEKRSTINGSIIWTQTIDPSAGWDTISSVAVDSGGVYLVGNDRTLGNNQWRIEKRSLIDGSVIWTQSNNPSLSWDMATDVTLDPTGVYVVGGSEDFNGANHAWHIEKRSLIDGSVIWSRDSDPSAGWDNANGVAVDATGVYVAGTDESLGGSNQQWRIEKRSLIDGSVIWTQATDPSAGWDTASAIAVDATGMYVVGSDFSSGNNQWRIEKRSLIDGSVIWTQANNPSLSWDMATDVTLDPTGVYVVGGDFVSGNNEWRIEKRSLIDGGIIWKQVSDSSTGWDNARGVAVDATGVYVVGNDRTPGNQEWHIEKRKLNPTQHVAGTPTGFVATPSSCGNAWLNLSWNTVLTIPGYEVKYIVTEGARVVYDGTSTAVSDLGLALGSTHSYAISASYFEPAVYDIDGTEINPQNTFPIGAIASAPAFATGTVADICHGINVDPATYSTTLPAVSFTALYSILSAGGGTCRLLDFAGTPLTAPGVCSGSITYNAPAVAGVYAYSMQLQGFTTSVSNVFTVTVNPAPPAVVSMTPDFTVQSGAPWDVTMTASPPFENYRNGCWFTRQSAEYGNTPTVFVPGPVYTVSATPGAFVGPGTLLYSAKCLSASQVWSPLVTTTVTVLPPEPSFSLSPVLGSFNFVPIGGMKVITIQVENPTGDATSILTGNITFSDPHFTCTPAPCDYAVPVGGSATFDIVYTPDVVGADSGNIIFTDNAPGSPHTWAIWGVGIVPVIALPPQVDFGNVPVSRSKEISFTIKNISPTNLGLSTFGGYDGVVYQCVSPLPPAVDTCAPNSIDLTPNFENIVTLRFIPTASQAYHQVGTLSTLPDYNIFIDGAGVSPSFDVIEE